MRRENFAISSENGVVLWELLKAGYGMTFMPEYLGERTPGVEKVIPNLPSLEFPWLVTHRELKTSPRIRWSTIFWLRSWQSGSDPRPAWDQLPRAASVAFDDRSARA